MQAWNFSQWYSRYMIVGWRVAAAAGSIHLYYFQAVSTCYQTCPARKATLTLQRVWQGGLVRQWIRRLNESAVDIQRRARDGGPCESHDLMLLTFSVLLLAVVFFQ